MIGRGEVGLGTVVFGQVMEVHVLFFFCLALLLVRSYVAYLKESERWPCGELDGFLGRLRPIAFSSRLDSAQLFRYRLHLALSRTLIQLVPFIPLVCSRLKGVRSCPRRGQPTDNDKPELPWLSNATLAFIIHVKWPRYSFPHPLSASS